MSEIELNSNIRVKESPDCKPIIQKAVAGASDAELIERYTIGQYEDEEDKDVDEDQD